MGKTIQLTGQRFGRLLVIESAGRNTKNRLWLCLCSCNVTKVVSSSHLTSGFVKSCGCLQAETRKLNGANRRTHGCARPGPNGRSPEYRSWRGTKDRCNNPKNPKYADYGGRGIKVCDRWINSFENFLLDMGPRTEGTSLDRIDGNVGYEPSNCRWATISIQNRNRRKPKNTASVFRGVSPIKERFRAVITTDGGHRQHLGTFDSEIEAALASNEAAKVHFGAFANLNEITEQMVA